MSTIISVETHNPANKVYLGDSVYADFDGYGVILTTENGYGPSNTICMEPEVVNSFINYAKKMGLIK